MNGDEGLCGIAALAIDAWLRCVPRVCRSG